MTEQKKRSNVPRRSIYEEIEVEMARCFGEKKPDLLAIRKKISDIAEA